MPDANEPAKPVTTSEQENRELLARVARGDMSALNPLFEKLQDLVATIIVRELLKRNGRVTGMEVSDYLSVVFLRVAKSSHTYNPEIAYVTTWVGTIARNTVIDLLEENFLRQMAEKDYVARHPAKGGFPDTGGPCIGYSGSAEKSGAKVFGRGPDRLGKYRRWMGGQGEDSVTGMFRTFGLTAAEVPETKERRKR